MARAQPPRYEQCLGFLPGRWRLASAHPHGSPSSQLVWFLCPFPSTHVPHRKAAVQALLDHGLHFRIVFFEANKLCFTRAFGRGHSSPQSLLLYRASLIQHLISTCSSLQIEQFSHWYAEEWENFVSFHRPSFLLFDGGNLECDSLVSLGLNAIVKGIGLASIADIQQGARSIVTFCVEPLKNVLAIQANEKLYAMQSEVFARFTSMALKHNAGSASSNVPEPLPDFFLPPPDFPRSIQIIDEICSVGSFSFESGQWRSIIAAIGCRSLLLSRDASAEDQDFSKLFLLHIVMMDHCHILWRPRAYSMGKETENPFNKQLDRLCAVLHLLVDHISRHSSKLNAFRWDLADLIDFRYMVAIAHYMEARFAPHPSDQLLTAESLGLEVTVAKQLDALWSNIVIISTPQTVEAEAGGGGGQLSSKWTISSSFFPLSRPFWNIQRYGNFEDLKNAPDVIKHDMPLVPVRSALSDKILPSWRPIIHDSHVSTFNELFGLKQRFMDDYHWHSGRLIDSTPQMIDVADPNFRGPRDYERLKRAWYLQAESLKARPNQSMSLHPVVLMASKGKGGQLEPSSSSSATPSSSSPAPSHTPSTSKGIPNNSKNAANQSTKKSATDRASASDPNSRNPSDLPPKNATQSCGRKSDSKRPIRRRKRMLRGNKRKSLRSLNIGLNTASIPSTSPS